jgi:hypothetical protein
MTDSTKRSFGTAIANCPQGARHADATIRLGGMYRHYSVRTVQFDTDCIIILQMCFKVRLCDLAVRVTQL